MTTARDSVGDYRVERRSAEVTAGESVRIIRELQEMSQNDLATAAGIPQSTISAIENGRVQLGLERAKTLARALKCHPAVLLFPGGANYTAGPKDRDLHVIADFLPSPAELGFKDDTVKVTIALSRDSVDFFKHEAAKQNTQYQKMIRRLLESYTQAHRAKR